MGLTLFLSKYLKVLPCKSSVFDLALRSIHILFYPVVTSDVLVVGCMFCWGNIPFAYCLQFVGYLNVE